MVGQSNLGIDGSCLCPLRKARMELRQFVDIYPDGLKDIANDGIWQSFVAEQVNVIGKGAGVLNDARG